MRQFGDIYRGCRVLLTGHTGFKGSWMAAWLSQMGAEVTGLALDPCGSPNHWSLLEAPVLDLRGDIRDRTVVEAAFNQAQPEIVFHMAAQALVRRSYSEPLESWSSNVMGTANVLDVCRRTPGLRAVVVATTDKVYINKERVRGYRETDRLGGHDPYSASKAACELVSDSYRKSFFHSDGAPLVATARSGNVIGGGDWSEDRLIPDLVRAALTNRSLEVRSPDATRPWQHVLECISGYLLLGQHLLEGKKEFADAWNFGPVPEDNCTVAEMLITLKRFWSQIDWHTSTKSQPHEAKLLYLDCAKARNQLLWKPVWSLEEGLAMTAHWYRQHYATGEVATIDQLFSYLDSAQAAASVWIAR